MLEPLKHLTASRSLQADQMIIPAGEVVENWASPCQVIKGNRHQGGDVAGECQNGYLRFYYLSSFKHNNEIIVTLNWQKSGWLSSSLCQVLQQPRSGSPEHTMITLGRGHKEILVNLQACSDFGFWPRHCCLVHEKLANFSFSMWLKN